MRNYDDLNFLQRLVLYFAEWIEKKVYKRDWTFRQQVRYAEIKIDEELQWMYVKKPVRMINERHLKLVTNDWYTTQFSFIENFRKEVYKELENED